MIMNNIWMALLVVSLASLGCKPKEDGEMSVSKVPLVTAPSAKIELSRESMVWIPPGTFEMGSEKNQDEQPIHKVKLDGFWIGKYEITNEEYTEFVTDARYKTIAERKPRPEDFPEIPPEEFKNIKAGSIVFTPPDEDIPVERLKAHNAFLAWWKYVPGGKLAFP